ncbi:MAG: YegS/Rv2252/BmrU family lipid kinase [Clostridia bacterium]|nr:YegS/Rv2252/BmrU family lipid kinase [Clostridia bacterium]
MKYLFIVNGKAGSSTAKEKLEEQIKRLKTKIDYDIYETVASRDATRYVAQYVKENKNADVCFVAFGGDGTLNEVASGAVGSNKKVAVLSYGSGNDFIKYYKGLQFDDLNKLVDGKVTPIDVLKINDRYAVNVCNFGFDSVVGSTANKVKEKGGKDPYGAGVRAGIFKGRFNKIKVVADGKEISKHKMLLCTLANCHYVGGKFFCAPKAVNDDGYIDVCLFHAMSLLGFLKVLTPYTNGEHLDNPKFADKLVYTRAKTVEVSSEKPIELCLDGEMYAGTRFDVTILPKALNFVVPKA